MIRGRSTDWRFFSSTSRAACPPRVIGTLSIISLRPSLHRRRCRVARSGFPSGSPGRKIRIRLLFRFRRSHVFAAPLVQTLKGIRNSMLPMQLGSEARFGPVEAMEHRLDRDSSRLAPAATKTSPQPAGSTSLGLLQTDYRADQIRLRPKSWENSSATCEPQDLRPDRRGYPARPPRLPKEWCNTALYARGQRAATSGCQPVPAARQWC